jgi:hypothetical protein
MLGEKKGSLEALNHLHSRRVCQRCCYPQRIRLVRFIRHYHQYTLPIGACDLLIKPKPRQEEAMRELEIDERQGREKEKYLSELSSRERGLLGITMSVVVEGRIFRELEACPSKPSTMYR